MGAKYHIVKIAPRMSDFVPYVSQVVLHPFDSKAMQQLDLVHKIGLVVEVHPFSEKVTIRYDLPSHTAKVEITVRHKRVMIVEGKKSVFPESNPNRTFKNRRS